MRLALTLFLLLMLLVTPGGTQTTLHPPAAIRTELDDYAGLTPSSRGELARRTRDLLDRNGISATVEVCAPNDAVRCAETNDGTRRIFIRLLPGPRDNESGHVGRCFGTAVVGREGGVYAKVFVASVKDAAAEADLTWMTLLVYVTAHEVGHLLLGGREHSQSGLMKANWDAKDYRAMGRDLLSFTPAQIEALHKAYGPPLELAEASKTSNSKIK